MKEYIVFAIYHNTVLILKSSIAICLGSHSNANMALVHFYFLFIMLFGLETSYTFILCMCVLCVCMFVLLFKLHIKTLPTPALYVFTEGRFVITLL